MVRSPALIELHVLLEILSVLLDLLSELRLTIQISQLRRVVTNTLAGEASSTNRMDTRDALELDGLDFNTRCGSTVDKLWRKIMRAHAFEYRERIHYSTDDNVLAALGLLHLERLGCRRGEIKERNGLVRTPSLPQTTFAFAELGKSVSLKVEE